MLIMSQLTSPQMLFAKQKLFSIATEAQNNATKGIVGNNQSKVAALFCYPKTEILEGEERIQLVNILAACKLSEAEVVFVNTAFIPQFALSNLRSLFPLQIIIQFGNFAISNNLNLSRHKSYTVDNIQFIKTESLETLIKDKKLKGQFWAELRKIFSI